MKTKTKNGFLKVAGSMMAVTMLATCVVAGTMAKYTTTNDGLTAKAQVAKWSITVGDTELKELTMEDLDFNVYDTAGGGGRLIDMQVHDGVDGVHGVIAPGTWGYATVEIKNESQVDADISATFTKESSGLPAGMTVVALDSGVPNNVSDVTGDTTTVENKDVAPNTQAMIVIAFKWDFDDAGKDTYDSEDTALGEAAEELTLGSLAITATQVD